MIILGLTGSIAMGKSETASMFRRLGVPVFDADGVVHRAQAKDGVAIPAISKLFEGVVTDGVLDRAKLGTIVFADRPRLADLVNVMTPIIRQARAAFFNQAIAEDEKIVVLDEPLLFENGGDKQCDAIIVVSAPEHIQRARAMARSVMTEEKLAQILAQQMPDQEKRAKADYIIETDKGLDHAFEAVKGIISEANEITPRAYKEYWENAGNNF